jgi:hypothetical protein
MALQITGIKLAKSLSFLNFSHHHLLVHCSATGGSLNQCCGRLSGKMTAFTEPLAPFGAMPGQFQLTE